MPIHNQFCHQDYFTPEASFSYHMIEPPPPAMMGSTAYAAAMMSAGRLLREAQVAAIYLVHGTVTGTDATGLHRTVFGKMPGLGSQMSTIYKNAVDSIFGDTGNYTDEFMTAFRAGIQPTATHTLIRRFLWTSENHHLGRADAAVRLIDELSRLDLQPRQRIMLWGHSHAGNVFALLTNLVGGDQHSRNEFLNATRDFQPHGAGEVWDRVRCMLADADAQLWAIPLDLVTFGTPVRYGWETQGYDKLLHIINHHAMDANRPANLPFPPSADQILAAAAGDYFQQLFIAGTDFPPNLWDWRLRQINRGIARIVQHRVRGTLLERWQQGRRVPDESRTLLVDYAVASPHEARLLAGHGIYTRLTWLPFHLTQVVQHFYGGE